MEALLYLLLGPMVATRAENVTLASELAAKLGFKPPGVALQLKEGMSLEQRLLDSEIV